MVRHVDDPSFLPQINVRLAKCAEASKDETWREILLELSNGLGFDKPLRLLFSIAEVSPMTWGIRRHAILLPSSAHDWSVERRRVVLAHELAHVKRNDGILLVLVQLACSIYWFNPLNWYAARRARIECERACGLCGPSCSNCSRASGAKGALICWPGHGATVATRGASGFDPGRASAQAAGIESGNFVSWRIYRSDNALRRGNSCNSSGSDATRRYHENAAPSRSENRTTPGAENSHRKQRDGHRQYAGAAACHRVNSGFVRGR